jgi:hypothetical protein
MADYLVFGAILFVGALLSLHFIGRVKDPDMRREMRSMAWVIFIIGLITFAAYSAMHGTNDKSVPVPPEPALLPFN